MRAVEHAGGLRGERRRERAPRAAAFPECAGDVRLHARDPSGAGCGRGPDLFAHGLLDLGRYPSGIDDVSEALAADLNESSFDANVDPEGDGSQVLQAALESRQCDRSRLGTRSEEPAAGELLQLAQDEGANVFAAAGIEVADPTLDAERRAAFSALRRVGAGGHTGGSSWQSLARSTGNIEADWLNGEVVLLGRMHQVATPVNELLCSTANRMAKKGSLPARSLPSTCSISSERRRPARTELRGPLARSDPSTTMSSLSTQLAAWKSAAANMEAASLVSRETCLATKVCPRRPGSTRPTRRSPPSTGIEKYPWTRSEWGT